MAQVGQHNRGAFVIPVRGGSLDADIVRQNDNDMATTYNTHDNDPSIHIQSDTVLPGVLAAGSVFWATGTNRLSISTGAVWSSLTLDAASVTTGTLPVARLAGAYTGITGVGTLASLTISGSLTAPTITGATTFDAAPTLSALTASQAVFTNASKTLVSTALTGSGNVVMSNSPTLTGVVSAASGTFSGTLSVDGTLTAVGTLQANAVTVTTTIAAASLSTTGAVAAGGALSGTTITGTGLLNIAAAGAGRIQFPATQNASADPNTLDDYEEGTFTPAGNGVTFTSSAGSYTKVGRAVHVRIEAVWPVNSNGSPARITGLPFSPSAGTSLALWSNKASTVVQSLTSGSSVYLYAVLGQEHTNQDLSGVTVILSGTYFV